MRKLIAATAVVMMGCGGFSLPDVEVVSKQPAVPPGYILATYEVRCPGSANSLDVVPVHYYGPDFTVDDQFRRDERRRSCSGDRSGEGEVESDE